MIIRVTYVCESEPSNRYITFRQYVLVIIIYSSLPARDGVVSITELCYYYSPFEEEVCFGGRWGTFICLFNVDLSVVFGVSCCGVSALVSL